MAIDMNPRFYLRSVWRRILGRVQLRRYGRLVKKNGLFDRSYYLSRNPDVGKAGLDPLKHYFITGACEGRDPHPLFDTNYYLSCNPDVANSGLNPLAHYILFGRREGRNAHPSLARPNPTRLESSPNSVPCLSASATFEQKQLSRRHELYVLPPTESNLLNVPPRELIERALGGYWPETFLISGQETAENIGTVLAKIGRSIRSFDRILDFGCGCARTARFMIPFGAKTKPVCVDVDETQISYCNATLTALGEYICIPAVPPMPLESRKFDLIYSISTFTHFRSDFQHHWLRELKRLSAPGGILVLTISGPRNLQYASAEDLKRLAEEGFCFIEGTQRGAHNPEYYHLTLHSHDYVRRVWGEYFEVLDIVPQIINNNQDAVLCRNNR